MGISQKMAKANVLMYSLNTMLLCDRKGRGTQGNRGSPS